MDELERTAETPAVASVRLATPAKLEMLDAVAAVKLASAAAGAKVLEGADIATAAAAIEKGERVSVLALAKELGAAREALRRVAAARLGLVAHAVAGHGAEDLPALADLGWGILSASGPEDSFDLTLVAHRAAEDSGVPFLVVHGLAQPGGSAGRALAMVALPHDRAIQSFVGAAGAPRARAAAASDRSFAERVPFALGAALREYGSVSGRRHDVFDKIPLGESPLVIVGTGPVGDALFCATNELRARGYDVGAVHLTSLRPFPGPRLVKALGRALAITVLEPADEPLTHGALLARDVKSAFTDALTWMPGFPGIGRIPKLFVGATGSAFDVSDLAAVCENMLADEHGKRIFSFVEVEHALARAPEKKEESAEGHESPKRAAEPDKDIALRFVVDDVDAADSILKMLGTALANGVGLRVHAIVTANQPGPGAVLDVFASRTHARGGMARRPPRLVVATERGVSSAGAVVPLSDGAVLVVVGSDPSAVLPEAARTVVRERRARVLPLALGEGATPQLVSAACAGAALATASKAMKMPLDPGAVASVVGDELGDTARRAFEATRDVLAAGA
jgi:pyruvate-ferredoxin/flavodoxin oxidoreductase